MEKQANKITRTGSFSLEKSPIWQVACAYAVVVAVSLLVRGLTVPFISKDMFGCLLAWYRTGEQEGMVALSRASNYNALYLYLMQLLIRSGLPFSPEALIKGLSALFDYACAAVMAFVTYQLLPVAAARRTKAFLAFALGCLSPLFLLNSAVWGQCDSGYSLFVLLCLYSFLQNKPELGIVFVGLGLCLKLQAVFILPVLFMLYLYQRKFSFFAFFLAPLVLLASGIPLGLMGGGWLYPVTCYLEQTQVFSGYMHLNYGGLFTILQFLGFSASTKIHMAGVLLTGVILLGMIWLYRKRAQLLEGNGLLRISAWFILTALYFLPKMHDRYAFVAEVLLTVWCVLQAKNLLDWLPLLLTWASSLCTYTLYLFEIKPVPISVLSVVNFVVLVLLAFPCLGLPYPFGLGGAGQNRPVATEK